MFTTSFRQGRLIILNLSKILKSYLAVLYLNDIDFQIDFTKLLAVYGKGF